MYVSLSRLRVGPARHRFMLDFPDERERYGDAALACEAHRELADKLRRGAELLRRR